MAAIAVMHLIVAGSLDRNIWTPITGRQHSRERSRRGSDLAKAGCARKEGSAAGCARGGAGA